MRADEGVVERGRGGDENMTMEEARRVQLSTGSRDGSTGADDSCNCGGHGEKILMSGKMRIAKIVKNNFIIASAISFDPVPKISPDPDHHPNPAVVVKDVYI